MTKFFDFALVNLLQDSFAKERARIVLQSFDFFWIVSVMWMCRPRKEWPPYFTLAINELPGMDEGRNSASTLPRSLTALVSDKFLFDQDGDDDDKKSVGSIGSDEIVCIVNPCNYTLEVDEYESPMGEISAFDPEIVEEEPENDGVKMSKEELQKCILDGSQRLQENLVIQELVLGVRDKKQSKKLKKEKAQ